MEKTKHETKKEVEMAFVLPKTLQAETQLMPMRGATIPMYAVYGKTDEPTPRRVWCATFVDVDESQAWVQASKVFGRAVKGAVIAGESDGKVVAENPAGIISRDPAEKLN